MFREVLDIASQTRMVHQPVVQFSVASQEEEGGQKQERSGGKYGQECAEYSQCQGDESKYGVQNIQNAVFYRLQICQNFSKLLYIC